MQRPVFEQPHVIHSLQYLKSWCHSQLAVFEQPDVIDSFQYLNSLMSLTTCSIWTARCHWQLAVFKRPDVLHSYARFSRFLSAQPELASLWICHDGYSRDVKKKKKKKKRKKRISPLPLHSLHLLSGYRGLVIIISFVTIIMIVFFFSLLTVFLLLVSLPSSFIIHSFFVRSYVRFVSSSLRPLFHSRHARFFDWLHTDVTDQKQLDHEADAADRELSPLCRCPLGGCGPGLCPSHWCRGTY